MAYFPPDLLKCVAFLGYKDQAGKFHFAGSAFWVSRITAGWQVHTIHRLPGGSSCYQEEIEANDFREKKANVIRVGDTTPQPNVTVGTVTFTNEQKE